MLLTPPHVLRVLVVSGRCPMNPALQRVLSSCIVIVAELGQDLPTDFFDIEIVETHLSGEEWKRVWDRDRQANQRVHLCLVQPASAIICRNVLEEYKRS